ncbi:MAG: hypothetical protein AB3N23_17770 [Paracoccaceae bacterium]
MSNVIHLNVPSQNQSQQTRLGALLGLFGQERRQEDDVFWLKENAELLNILECTGADVDLQALSVHREFYDSVERRMGFFPQYYRFLLSICLDLEALGMPGDKGEALVHWAAREGLADAEMSDLQRAEARRLMQRRGVDPQPEDQGLTNRLHAFIDRSDTFAVPNKKAAYELTHIVFYLSEYGRRDPGLSRSAITSLEFAGILAYLDQNVDLLSEICVALRYAGQTPSQIWEEWLEREVHRFAVSTDMQAPLMDQYHDWFVGNWLMAVSDRRAFAKPVSLERTTFHRGAVWDGPLRRMSECMFEMDGDRSDDWHHMRPHIEDRLSEVGHDILCEALESTDKFEAFFAGFARTRLSGVVL